MNITHEAPVLLRDVTLSSEIAALSSAAAICGASSHEAHRWAELILNADAKPDRQPMKMGHSALNANGSPLELCVTSSASDLRCRIVGDPGYWQHNPGLKLKAAIRALEAISRDRQATPELAQRLLNWSIDCTLRDRLDCFPDGVFWLAAGLGSPGLAAYVDASGGGVASGWLAMKQWARYWLSSPTEVEKLLDNAQRVGTPASYGIEGTNLTDARIKLYFRLARQSRLDELHPWLMQPAMLRFLGASVATGRIPASGMVISLGFALHDGSLTDGKIDLCGHCIAIDPKSWTQLIDEQTAEMGLAAVNGRALLEDLPLEIAFLGLGLAKSGKKRLNVYLRSSSIRSAISCSPHA